ncbi:LETM1 domain-containing protein [Polaribacter sp. 20A6]|uniref:LETM1 domain-containing protein n=1 Tax=Polaribacter sp. 20A6 TaxID=2687289 RepID=UPI0013FDD79A|nr:LETM1 domain-containing protein [Polaribacter sp. 20A6]
MTSIEEIKLLIYRNKLRLAQELRQSKEAVFLIKKATHSNLTPVEKEKIKIQLLDICKAIPALAVFLLPGGALLLPLLIKLIPDILPSAFKDDLPNDKTESS